ncbi:MAG: CopD family protein [Chitinophagales bacterium]|nr:CopD family protein [Bacteroidota bacterium]MBK9557532.1 CopD family protein [Bacteroidota bacterium]MBL0282258.1 CopD family protein [Bacteroidota bacterium]
MAYYSYFVAAHIIFIVTWFAALFYIVRLYIYHTEALQRNEPDKSILATQFIIMERRLMSIIGTPSMILVVITGSSLLYFNQQFLQEGWMHMKLFFIVCIIAYHFSCLRIQKRLSKQTSKLSSQQLRLFNELATIFLVAIVFLIELKNTANMLYGLLGLLLLAVIMMIAVKIYKRKREA